MKPRLAEQKLPAVSTPPPRQRKAGVSLASVVLSAGAVVVGVLASSAWWTLHTHRQTLERSRREQVEVVSELLGQTVERMLGEGELASVVSGVRAMVSESAARYGLEECRVVLGDGTVLADRDSSQLSKVVPDSWPVFETSASSEVTPGRVVVQRTLTVPGKGSASLELATGVSYPLWADWETQLGIGVIGVGGLLGLLGLNRAMQRRWRSLSAVGGALRLAASGESQRGMLNLSEDLGPEAAAWNTVIEERDRWRDELEVTRCGEQLTARRSGHGELGVAFEAMWQGILVLNADGKVLYANGAAGVLLGRAAGELAGTAFSAAAGDAKLAEAAEALCQGRSRQRTEVELRRQGGAGEPTVIRAVLRPVQGESASVVVVLEDVTQQRVADESRNGFVAQATHELRTPLTNIRLYVETLVEEGEDAAVRAKCLNVINSESRRLERIVGDMLSVAEIEAGALKLRLGEVRVEAMFEELEADFRAQAEDKEIALKFEMPPKVPVLEADRDRLMLALHNLVGNALKYTPAGGKVGVRVTEEAGGLRVDVSDTGIGIKADEQELVFERFYRAKDKRIAGITGSGIGLALARQVVRLHGGDIVVRSEIDKGSTFTLVMPVTQTAMKAAA